MTPYLKSISTKLFGLFLLILQVQTWSADKPYEYKPADLKQMQNANSPVMVMPAKFLREFDPLTIMYNQDKNPKAPGPLNNPADFVRIIPAQPGEYRWIDPRTIEFRPSIPWKPMQVYVIKASGITQSLTALLSPPKNIFPASGSRDLAPFSRVQIEFEQPVNPDILTQLVTFECNPLPGIDRNNPKIYGSADYYIKVSEKSKKGSYLYDFVFKNPFPNGQRIRTIVKLSTDPELSHANKVYIADTRREFTMEKAGTYQHLFTLNSAGSTYGKDQAIRLASDGVLIVDFSARPASLSLSQVRSLLNFSPAPSRMDWSLSGSRLTVRLAVEQERIYQVMLSPVGIQDVDGRVLQLKSPSSFFFYQPLDQQFARWGLGRGLLERFGPQHFPLLVNGVKSLDIRAHKIDPLHKAFWPFPTTPVFVNESNLPPGPGEEPVSESQVLSPLSSYEMGTHIRMLGSPHYSAILNLDQSAVTRFQSIDLKPILSKISGEQKPGTYLVGFRTLDGSAERAYIRIQVTDLSLSSVESKNELLFVVSSLSTGKPVADAEVLIEGMSNNQFQNLSKGKTNSLGMLRIVHNANNHKVFQNSSIKRVVVRQGTDVLVLDSRLSEAPPEFVNNHWRSNNRSAWLDWLSDAPYAFENDQVSAGFVFTERPIYKPNETVYFKFLVRTLNQGSILKAKEQGTYKAQIVSPSGLTYDFPAKLSTHHSYSDSLREKDLPTGTYELTVLYNHPSQGQSLIARTSFMIESYKIPKFEVKLNGPSEAANDGPVTIKLNASYYAGGKVAGQNVAWKVVSYPYAYAPNNLKGYMLSTDNRYGAVNEDHQESSIESQDVTDDNGQSVLVVNPQNSTKGNPRRYICEATVTDVDEQTVSNRHSFIALPPFVLGLQVNRHITNSTSIKADVVTVGIGGKFEAGHKVSAVLKKMSWISYLQETDFSRGKPKYRTQESLELIGEKSLTSSTKPMTLEFKDQSAGVYILEVSSRDRLGRLQSVKADLFVAGDQPVTWNKKDQLLFETVPDQDRYLPGQVAKILLKSPYQSGSALAVVESPSGTPEYHWVPIANGQGMLSLALTPSMAPRVPISFLLMRPRISQEKRTKDGSTVDAGRPQSVANTTWLNVEQSENILKVSLDHLKQVRPGDTLPIQIGLLDNLGKPRAGEVALWLVDESVLSLAKEKQLNPLPAFTPNVNSQISIRDIRNMIMGDLRVVENPGGDGEEGSADLFGKMTVRKNFKTVPYWNPSIKVETNGKTQVKVPISDDLTNFAIRAVATSAMDRFGLGTSQVKVRLPVLVQPALPRFVRLGDKFTAGGVARIVEGNGGAGSYTIQTKGLLASQAQGVRSLNLEINKPQLLKEEFLVQEPGFDELGKLRYDSVSLQMSVVRTADKASDAFAVSLPLRMDRSFIEEDFFSELNSNKPLTIPALPEPARANTLSRQLVVSNQLSILKALMAMNSLLQFPYGCTEQQISRTLPSVLYRDIWSKYGLKAPDNNLKKSVASTMEAIKNSQNPDGLMGYWPASTGYIYLTAYAVEFMAEVKRANDSTKAGFAFNSEVYQKAISALKRGLRSDYGQFVSGYAYYERTVALLALAKAGQLDIGYARELSAKTNELDVQSMANVFEALQTNRKALETEISSLQERLWKQTVFKQEKGKEVFAGLQQSSFRIGERVHTNEISALASLISALSVSPKAPEKLPMLVGQLLSLGGQTDWGSTQANSMALQALRNYISQPQDNMQVNGKLNLGSRSEAITYNAKAGALLRNWADPAKAELRFENLGTSPLYARYTQRYLPQKPGSESPAKQSGFVVKRELIFINNSTGKRKVLIEKPGMQQVVQVGDIIEEHIQIENPKDRFFVAVSAPFAAGLEYMNPRLETSGEEAKPSGITTNPGDYQAFNDDAANYFFEKMPAGTYHFYFRVRASTEGSFSHPAARAEMMYDMRVFGNSPGTRIVVQPSK